MKRPQKYNSVKTDCHACGKSHPSKKEAKRCGELVWLQKVGEITDLRNQVAFPLFGPGGLPLMSEGRAGGTHKQQLRMTWDFVYMDEDGQVAEDSKGMATPSFKLRLAVFRACYPDIRVVIS